MVLRGIADGTFPQPVLTYYTYVSIYMSHHLLGLRADKVQNASSVATQLRSQTSFVIDAVDTRRKVSTSVPYDGENGLDVAAWTRTREDGVQETLVLAAQVFYNFAGSPTGTIDFELIGLNGTVKEVLFGGVNMTESGSPMFSMERTSVAGVILEG